jgi:hypothetical protein
LNVARYEPSNQLHLWLLTRPRQPLPVGELNLVRSNQGVSLRYLDSWLQSGFPLSEDLPLIDEDFLPAEKGRAVGARPKALIDPACGVTGEDIDLYAEQIDRPFLRDQREGLRTGADPRA